MFNGKKNILFFFNKFQLILLCLIIPKMKEVVTKYVVCYTIISAVSLNVNF